MLLIRLIGILLFYSIFKIVAPLIIIIFDPIVNSNILKGDGAIAFSCVIVVFIVICFFISMMLFGLVYAYTMITDGEFGKF